MPFTGQYTYMSPADYFKQQFSADQSAFQGGGQFNLGSEWIDQLNEGNLSQIKNPYYGLSDADLMQKITGGDFASWLAGRPHAGDEGGAKLVNGQVQIPTYQDPGDSEGMGVMAALTAAFGGLAAGAGGAGAAGSNFVGDLPLATDATGSSIYSTLGGGTTGGSNFVGDLPMASDAGTGLTTGIDPSTGQFAGETSNATTGANSSIIDTIKNLPTSVLKTLGLTNTDGSVNNAAMLSLLGKLGAAGVQAFSSSNAADAYQRLADQYLSLGAPSRARFEASMTPGFDPTSIPGYQGAVDNSMQTMLRKLSTTGNPFGNPGGLIEANKAVVSGTALPAIQEYQRLNLGAGGTANLNAAVPNLATGAIGQDANVYGAIGSAIGSATQPANPYEDFIKQLTGQMKLNTGNLPV